MIDILVAGGPVMVFLLLAAVLAIAYVVERVIVLARLPSHEGGAQAVADVEQVLFDQGREVAAERCKAGRGILNYIFASLIKRCVLYKICFKACYVRKAVYNLFDNISRTSLRRKMGTVRFS